MRVHVADLVGRDARVARAPCASARCALALGRGRGDVVRVRARAVAHHLGVDVRAALLRVLVLLEDEDARALARDEAVAVLVERPARLLRRVVPLGERASSPQKPPMPSGRDGRLAAAGDHHVREAALDVERRVADRVVAGRAGGHGRVVRALQRRSFRLICPGARLMMRLGMKNGPIVRTPFSRNVLVLLLDACRGRRCRRRRWRRPARALPSLRPCRGRASFIAISAAASANWMKRSFRRASFRSMNFVGSKSFTSPAMRVGKRATRRTG